MPRQQNPFSYSAQRHRSVVTGTASASIALVLVALVGFPTLIEQHLNAPVVLSMANTFAPTADDRYLSPDQVMAALWWWLVPFVIFLAVFAYGLFKRRAGSTLTGAAGVAAFGSIYAGMLVGIAVTNLTDISPTLQPFFCLLIYMVLSTPFLMAFIGDMGKKTTTD